MKLFETLAILTLAFLATASNAEASPGNCKNLPSYQDLKSALSAVKAENNGGFGFDMWGALVDRDGVVCAIARTGAGVGDQWPGSRGIAAEKANTANALSLPKFAMSTANLYSGSQPGGFLYGIQSSSPVNAVALSEGSSKHYGMENDPMVGKKIGGVILFGGGLALYNAQGDLLGAIGVSGDSSCADHNIAWKTRHALKLDYVPAGPSPTHDDGITYLNDKEPANGFKHPICGHTETTIRLPPVSKR